MNCIIYAIKNLNDMKVYVGSSKEYTRRETNHRYALNHDKHVNPHLQNAWNRDGEDAFTFSVLEIIDDQSLLRKREQWWINHLTPFGRYGYNIRKDVNDGRRGTTCPEEIRLKISNSMKGKERSEEYRRNIALAHIGKPHPTPWMVGRCVSEESKEKNSLAHKGKRCGSSNNKAKITEDDVLVILKRLDAGESGYSIAKDYGVNRQVIYRIKHCITWKHVERE